MDESIDFKFAPSCVRGWIGAATLVHELLIRRDVGSEFRPWLTRALDQANAGFKKANLLNQFIVNVAVKHPERVGIVDAH